MPPRSRWRPTTSLIQVPMGGLSSSGVLDIAVLDDVIFLDGFE